MASAREIRAILGALRRNPALLSTLRTELDALVASTHLTSTGGREMVNGSGNGMAYTAQITMTQRERMANLQAVLEHYERGTTPSAWSQTRFRD